MKVVGSLQEMDAAMLREAEAMLDELTEHEHVHGFDARIAARRERLAATMARLAELVRFARAPLQ